MSSATARFDVIRTRWPRWAGAIVIAAGLLLRFGVAGMTSSPDAATLAWGSAIMAQGHLDPWSEVIDHPEHDPIPLSEIRALSLAQGPLGVAAGAVTMKVADVVGLIELDDQPDGTKFGVGELVAYKISYLLPELILAVSLVSIAGKRRRLAALMAWAFNPLVIFTWGQGMPDTWTVAVCVAALAILQRASDAPTRERVRGALMLVSVVVPLGAFSTKLLPLVILVPIVAVVLSHELLERRDRWRICGAAAGSVALGALPYVLSAEMRTNVMDRFEVFMLNSNRGITMLHATPDAQWSMVVVVAVSAWFFIGRPSIERIAGWLCGVVIAISMLSGVLPHLLFWVSVPLLVAFVRAPRIHAAMSVALAVFVTWHLLSYTWVEDLVSKTLGSEWVHTGSPMSVLVQQLPGPASIGAFIATATLATLVVFLWVTCRESGPAMTGPISLRWSSVVAGATAAILGLALFLNPVLAAKAGTVVFSEGEHGEPTQFLLEAGKNWTSEPMSGDERANYAQFKLAHATWPTRDEIRVDLIDASDRVQATGSVPVWQAEPQSDRLAAKVELDRRPVVRGLRLRLTRVVVGDRAASPVPVVLQGATSATSHAGASETSGSPPSALATTSDGTQDASMGATQTDANASATGASSTGRFPTESTSAAVPMADMVSSVPQVTLRDDRASAAVGAWVSRVLSWRLLVALFVALALGAGCEQTLGRRSRVATS